MRRALQIVGSAIEFPHGVIDPIEELAAIAAEFGIGMHVDACLGGLLLPFAEMEGYACRLGARCRV
jgi:glutamate/tyrosine decarboxylase-like PLP-dependent enzyme